MVSIKDVAKLANVSPTTVSKVLNHKGAISAATTQRVLDAVNQLGYSPSSVARSLVNGNIGIIAVMLEDLADPFFLDLIAGINSACAKSRFEVIYCSIHSDAETRRKYIQTVKNGLADGMIIYGSFASDDEEIRRLISYNYPLVVIENELHQLNVNSLLIDNISAAKTATFSLIKQGHKRIAHIAGPPHVKVAVDRLEGYKKALKLCGILSSIDKDMVVYTDRTYAGGYRQMQKLLSLQQPPTAVFCFDDVTALGAIDAIYDSGLQVPRDISIIGFDDQKILPSHKTSIELSTMRQPLFELGQDSFQILTQAIDNPKAPIVCKQYAAQLVIRASSSSLIDPLP